MMPDLAALSPMAIIGAVLVFYSAGVVKGAIGFAMPLIIISTVSLFIDPLLVVASLIFPILISNLSQMFRQGPRAALDALQEHWLFAVILCTTIFVTAQVIQSVPTKVIFIGLGGAVSLISLIQLSGWKPVVPAPFRPVAAVIGGLFAGIMGGFSGTWGPATVLYLLALDTPKARQVTVQGVLFALGGVPLFLGHLRSGVLNGETAIISAVMIVPVVLGMWTGFRVQDRIDQATFRKATLAVLLLAGANLMRRGLLMG